MHILYYSFLVGVGLFVLLFSCIFVVALVKTIKEFRCPDAAGMNAGLGFGGELGVNHIKKAKTKK